jgi:heat shock protein HslJ
MKRKLVWLVGLVCLAALLVWMVLFPPLPAELIGREWRLEAVQVVGGPALWRSSDPDQFTLTFGSTTMSGHAGCNSYEARHRVNQFTRSFSTGPVFHTMVGCLDPDLQAREETFFDALGSASRYELSGDELRVYFDDGTKMLVFRGS